MTDNEKRLLEMEVIVTKRGSEEDRAWKRLHPDNVFIPIKRDDD